MRHFWLAYQYPYRVPVVLHFTIISDRTAWIIGGFRSTASQVVGRPVQASAPPSLAPLPRLPARLRVAARSALSSHPHPLLRPARQTRHTSVDAGR